MSLLKRVLNTETLSAAFAAKYGANWTCEFLALLHFEKAKRAVVLGEEVWLTESGDLTIGRPDMPSGVTTKKPMSTDLDMAWKQLEGWAKQLAATARQMRTGEPNTNLTDEPPCHAKVERLLRQCGEIHGRVKEIELDQIKEAAAV